MTETLMTWLAPLLVLAKRLIAATCMPARTRYLLRLLVKGDVSAITVSPFEREGDDQRIYQSLKLDGPLQANGKPLWSVTRSPNLLIPQGAVPPFAEDMTVQDARSCAFWADWLPQGVFATRRVLRLDSGTPAMALFLSGVKPLALRRV